MTNLENNQLTDESIEDVFGGKTTDTHKFYSAETKKLIGEIVIVDGKVISHTGTIPNKYKYLLK